MIELEELVPKIKELKNRIIDMGESLWHIFKNPKISRTRK